MTDHDTKTAIVNSAISLLGRAGLDGFSASALAGEAGVSKATLFHHFRSIDEIPIAALDLMLADAMQMDLPSDAGLADILDAFGAMTFDFLDERRGFLNAYFAFVSKSMFSPELLEKMQISLTSAKQQVAQLFVQFTENEEVARDVANIVMTTLDGAMMHMMLLGNETEVRAMWSRMSRLLVDEYGQ